MRGKTDITQVPLFDGFEESAEAEWREAAEKTLKGVPLEKALVSGTWEGIRRQPIYHDAGGHAGAGIAGVVSGDDWCISQELGLSAPGEFNDALMGLLERGLGSVNVLVGEAGRDGLEVTGVDDFARAFEGVIPDAVGWRFGGATGIGLLAVFAAWLERKGVASGEIRGCLGLDPLGETVGGGRRDQSVCREMDEVAACAIHNIGNMPGFRAGLVNTMAYHEAGASAVTELGVSMASGIWMIRELCGRGMEVSAAASQIAFTLAVGSDFFMEIAKFRAARLLWARIVEDLGGDDESCEMRLHARTGCYQKTRRQPQTNLVRATTEALAAVMGGVDSLCVGAFDESCGRGSGFSRRIAVNLQLVLQEECGLDVVDPAGGSYYIEALTEQVAEAAWEELREIEAGGGIVESLRSGYVEKQIDDTHAKREQALAHRRASLVGVNCYIHAGEDGVEESDFAEGVVDPGDGCGGTATGETWKPEEQEALIPSMVKEALAGSAMADLGPDRGAMFAGGPASGIRALPPRRLAQHYEWLSVRVARHLSGDLEAPRIGIVRLGAPGRCRPKVEFVRDFFSVGGFEFEEVAPAADPVVVLAEVSALRSEVLVICAGPDVESGVAVEVIRAMMQGAVCQTILVAMKPDAEEAAWREAGVDDFVFRGCDNYQMNRRVLATLGIEI